MVAVGAFATTRRERELMLRMQHRAEETTASLAMAVRTHDNPAYYRDTQPLLGVSMHQPPAMMMPPGMMPAPMQPMPAPVARPA